METDTTGKIYLSSPEHNSINTFDPATGLVSPFVRSPLMAWPDTMRQVCAAFLAALRADVGGVSQRGRRRLRVRDAEPALAEPWVSERDGQAREALRPHAREDRRRESETHVRSWSKRQCVYYLYFRKAENARFVQLTFAFWGMLTEGGGPRT